MVARMYPSVVHTMSVVRGDVREDSKERLFGLVDVTFTVPFKLVAGKSLQDMNSKAGYQSLADYFTALSEGES